MDLAVCQFEPVVGDPAANLATMDAQLAALPAAVELAVFPELCVTGYDLDAAVEHAEQVPGPLTADLTDLAGDHDTIVVAGVPERDDSDVYNDLVCVDGDGVRAAYRKQFLWGDESDAFAAGDDPATCETPLGTLGLAVCYDHNFPEVGLQYARRDCDLLAVSAAWRRSYRDDWRLLSRARALDGPFYVAAADHVGDQQGREHAGHSLVASPRGEIVTEADAEPGSVTAAVDPAALSTAREKNPVLQTRNWPDA